MNDLRPMLFCTVGGTHAPVLTAIQSHPGAYVCFVCTGKDPVTGKNGSDVLVTGKGAVIKENPQSAPALPNIPVQAGLGLEDFKIVHVPADDLTATVTEIRAAVNRLKAQFPGSPFFADYTGGTKTMSAALVVVALETDEFELQLITGPRTDLRSIALDSASINTPLDDLRLKRRIRSGLELWSHFSFRKAADELNSLNVGAIEQSSRTRWKRAADLSNALAQWDDFEHKGACEVLKKYSRILGSHFGWMLPVLAELSNPKSKRHEPARLIDLWLNAERRASQGRYDDAVARWYRLLEWTAQWQLKAKLKVVTDQFPEKLLPPNSTTQWVENGRTRIGLDMAWQVVAHRLSGPAREFARTQRNKILDLVKMRNFSILAHGSEVVGQDGWREVQTWTGDWLLPLIRELADEVGLTSGSSHFPRQLPTELPESVLGMSFEA